MRVHLGWIGSLALGAVLGCGGRAGAEPADRSEGVRALLAETQCAPSPSASDRDAYLCAYGTPAGLSWFFIDASGLSLVRSLPTSGAALGEFSLSPDATRLVVVIGEEGHPTLLFFDLTGWDKAGTAPPRTIWSYSPYPGTIGFTQWRQDAIVVESDHDLLDPRGAYLVDAPPERATRSFTVDGQGRISRLTP